MKWLEQIKKKAIAKRRGIGGICPICANKNWADLYSEWGRNLNKKRIKETHARTSKWHRDLDHDETIHQWEVNLRNLVNFLITWKMEKALSLEKT